MIRIRQGWFVAAVALSALSLGACKKDAADKSASGPAGALAEKMGGEASGDDLSLLPIDSELVLGINFAQVQASPLWKQLIEPKILTGEAATNIAEFKTKCGFDPMTSIKSMTVGMRSLDGEGSKPSGVMVAHGVDKAKTWSCLEKMKEDMAKNGTEYTRDGEVALFKNPKEGGSVALTFVNDSTAVGVFGEQADAAGVKAAAAGGSALKSSPAFVDLYKKVNTGDSLWLVLNGNAKVFNQWPLGSDKPKAIFGSLNVTDGLALDGWIRFDTAKPATDLAEMGKAQLKNATQMVDKAEIEAIGNDVHTTVSLSAKKLQDLVAQFGMLFGGGSQ